MLELEHDETPRSACGIGACLVMLLPLPLLSKERRSADVADLAADCEQIIVSTWELAACFQRYF